MKKGIKGSFLTAAACLSLTLNTAIAAPEKLWSLEGFDEPESVLAHPNKPLLYVSNINGNPAELNGKGYISLLSDEGKVIRHVWVHGMNAPKGMAMDQTYLYVADMQQLHLVDHEKGMLVKSIKADDSVMLNDITIDDKGVVYISDLLGGGIYRYENDVLSKWISSDKLPHANGLLFQNGVLTVATWGKGLHDDFTTDVLGGLFTIDRETKDVMPYQHAQKFGNLDGIAAMGDSLLISDWMNGNISEYKNQQRTVLFNAPKHPADITAKGNILYVPMMFSKRLDAFLIKQ